MSNTSNNDFIRPEDEGVSGIDQQNTANGTEPVPYNEESFVQLGVLAAWEKYADHLSWGKGQTLAILDDGCDISLPQWQVHLPWGTKVIATWNSIDETKDCMHVPPGYHGSTVGNPSSMCHDGVHGVAYNNFVAHVRCVSVVHLTEDESPTIARALQWVLDHQDAYNITTINLAALDDLSHAAPVATCIDPLLDNVRQRGIWVSAPCGNHHFVDGISWPACQPGCVGVGATIPGKHEVHLDRFSGTDILATATATSSSNAYAAACSMILREAIALVEYPWETLAPTLPEAMLQIFQTTGHVIDDPESGRTYAELNLLAALDYVFA